MPNTNAASGWRPGPLQRLEQRARELRRLAHRAAARHDRPAAMGLLTQADDCDAAHFDLIREKAD